MIKTILKLSLLSLLIMPTSCLSINCTKIGYNQSVDGAFFDEKNQVGYFIYGYLENKEYKNYALYKVNLAGQTEKLVDLGSKTFNKDVEKNYSEYKFNLVDNKIFIQELNISSEGTNSKTKKYYSLIDLNTKKEIYKKEATYGQYYNERFSDNNKYLLETSGYYDLSIFDIEKGVYYETKINKNDGYFSVDWIGDNELIVYIKDKNNFINSLSIYTIENNNIQKTNEYFFKEEEKNAIPTNFIKYKNNILEYENEHYGNKTNNTYKLDFSKNNLILIKSEKNVNKTENYNNINKGTTLKASEKLYLHNLDTNKKIPIFDYLKELPKGYYNDETLCGNLHTMDKLQRWGN
ncbi:MAG: hypothetical protein U0457_20130 [Candidatus Sericytochromatia bacterium]